MLHLCLHPSNLTVSFTSDGTDVLTESSKSAATTAKVTPMVAARKKLKTDDKWMSLVEAARTLGESRQTVLMRAVKGDLEAEHIAGRTVVSRRSIERLIAAR